MKTFALERYADETWLDATLRHAAMFGWSKLDVMVVFAAHLKERPGDEEQAAICTLLEFDILPLRQEGITGS